MNNYILDYYKMDLLFDRGIILGLSFVIILIGVVTLNVFDDNVDLELNKIVILATFFSIILFLLSGTIISSKGLVIYFLMCVFTGLLSYYILMYLLRKDVRNKIIKKLFGIKLEDDNDGNTK